MRNAFIFIVAFLYAVPAVTGIIEHTVRCELPTMGKTIFMFGEEHTDPFDDAAVAQRQELARSVDAILMSHPGMLSCYLECDKNSKKDFSQSSYCELRNICTRGAYFEQWYVTFSRFYSDEVKKGQLCLSSFDIRDEQYAEFEYGLRSLVNGEITRDAIDFDALRVWADTVDARLHELLHALKTTYPKKMMAYIDRDRERKKKRFLRLIDSKRSANKRSRYTDRSLEDFYNYTDLLADFTILDKVANDPRHAIVVHAGSAHTENLSRYLKAI